MFDYHAIFDAKEVIVRSRATFDIGLDQGEDEISVSNVTSWIEDRWARWLRDVGDARLHASDPIAYFRCVLSVVAILDKAPDLIELQLNGNRLLEGTHHFPVGFSL